MALEKIDAPDYQKFREQLDCQSVMIVPLAAHGRLLGAMTFIRGKSQPRYAPADLAVAQEVAHQTASALDNARLYQQTRKAEAELQQLNAGLAPHFDLPGPSKAEREASSSAKSCVNQKLDAFPVFPCLHISRHDGNMLMMIHLPSCKECMDKARWCIQF